MFVMFLCLGWHFWILSLERNDAEGGLGGKGEPQGHEGQPQQGHRDNCVHCDNHSDRGHHDNCDYHGDRDHQYGHDS